MHTARSSSHLLGEGGVYLSPYWDTHTPGVGLETPLGVDLETPQPDPSTSPLGVGLETPLRPDRSTSPLGVGLETPLTSPWVSAWRHARHTGIPPPSPWTE